MPPKQEKRRSGLERLKAHELQELCEKQQVESSGTRAVMIERLMPCSISESTVPSSKGKEPASPESLDDTCGVIVITTTEIATESTMIEGAQQALEEVLEHEEFYVEYEPLHVGNQRGLSFIHLPRQMAIVEAKLASTETELTDTKMTAAAQEKRILSLETRVENLTTSLDAYKKIRHRFINTYAQTITLDMSGHTSKQIQEGNAAAHGGDAKTDANLYRDGKERNDLLIFEELYGFLPQVVWSFTHMESINILNIHAGIKADQREQINPRFYDLFANFIEAWKRSAFSCNYLGQGVKNCEEAVVYKAFWAFHEFLLIEEQRKAEARKKERAAGQGSA